jgi:hypothetical protein
VIGTNPAFVEAARFFFTEGTRGSQIPNTNGSSTRFKQYMAAKGFCTDVPFSHHVHLAHGLSAILQPELAAELSEDLRKDGDLFRHWWKR